MRAARKRCCGAQRSTILPGGAWSIPTATGSKSRASATTAARFTKPQSPASSSPGATGAAIRTRRPCCGPGHEQRDERYLRAVGYATKSRRGALPKMVLLGDIVGDDEDAVARATSEVVRIANSRSGEGFVAVNAEARKKFWLDRSRTAAIARHTNAFKINEDVVIPLERMGDYTDAIERITVELSFKNKLQLLDELQQYFAGELQLDEPLGDRKAEAQQVLTETRAR